MNSFIKKYSVYHKTWRTKSHWLLKVLYWVTQILKFRMKQDHAQAERQEPLLQWQWGVLWAPRWWGKASNGSGNFLYRLPWEPWHQPAAATRPSPMTPRGGSFPPFLPQLNLRSCGIFTSVQDERDRWWHLFFHLGRGYEVVWSDVY